MPFQSSRQGSTPAAVRSNEVGSGWSFEAWEHLSVDDGSDDGMAEEVEWRSATDRSNNSPRPKSTSHRTRAANGSVKDDFDEKISDQPLLSPER
jgi:hypothetical protein